MKKYKRKDKRTWYQKVSQGGKRYIDLSNPYNLARLTLDERYYLNYQEKSFGYNLEANIAEYHKYRNKKAFRELANKMRKQQYDLLSGQKYRQSLDTYGENYETAMKFNGYSGLVPLFKSVWGGLNYHDKENFGRNDLPLIPIFYKIKLKADSGKKENQIGELQVDSAMEDLAMRLLEEYANNGRIKDIEDKDLEKALQVAGIYDDVINYSKESSEEDDEDSDDLRGKVERYFKNKAD